MIVLLQVGLLLSLIVVPAFSIMTSAASDSTSARLGTFAFYYPWYGNLSHSWNHWKEILSNGSILHNPNITLSNGRRDIASEDYPLLGPYDSNDENVIEQQVDWAQEAGINCFIISWWGNGTFEDKALSHIRNVCEREKFNFTVYVENTTSIDQMVGNLTYLFTNYTKSSSWHKINGRPVIFIYQRAREHLNLDSQAWKVNGYYKDNRGIIDYWLLSEDVRKPPRYGIFVIHPYPNGTCGCIESASPIYLQPNEKYWLKVGISDVYNDSGNNESKVGFKIEIKNETQETLLDNRTVNFAMNWTDLTIPISNYAGQNVTISVESYNIDWKSEWAGVDYFYIINSSGGIVSPDPFCDNGWNATIRQIREKGFNPYVIMDFTGFEGKIDDFLYYFKDCVDGIHMYNPIGYSKNGSVSQVLDIYNIASESAHSRSMTFVATVVPGFNNSAVQKFNTTVIGRGNGSLYSSYWSVAKNCSADGYAITSFNEWHEGTEIEPSMEYGDQYINLTIPEFSSTIVLPLFMIATLLAVIVYRRKCHRWRMKIK